jgi:prepilin-type processing-associated H-X9-DG protein
MDPTWDIVRDDPTVTENPKMGWMRRLFGYVKDRNVYKCPSFLRPQEEGEFHYFLGARAAYARAAYAEWKYKGVYYPDHCRISVKRTLIEYPSAYVLGGDCNRKFARWDCDRDDFTQPCLGWKDVVEAENSSDFWERWHKDGLNVIFADAHVNWFTSYAGNLMTFSYNDYKNWAEALPAEAVAAPEP